MASPDFVEPLLSFKNVRAGYGEAIVLDDITFEMPERGSLAVLGRNGVGKSTLLLTLMGFTQLRRGSIVWRGTDITRMPPHRRAQVGIGWVAQEREIFANLSVEENLTVAARPGHGPALGPVEEPRRIHGERSAPGRHCHRSDRPARSG